MLISVEEKVTIPQTNNYRPVPCLWICYNGPSFLSGNWKGPKCTLENNYQTSITTQFQEFFF